VAEEMRCSLCGERTRLRAAFWARGVFLCDACWEAADRARLIPWWDEEGEGDG
jgi:formylmethanofuran dehydrogenase subunit E